MSDPRGLIDAYLDGDLSAEGERELRAWLESDRGNVRAFVRETCVHRSVRDQLVARRLVEALGADSGIAPCALPRRRRTGALWAAAAACLLAAIAFLATRGNPPAPPAAPAAPAPVAVSPGAWDLQVNVVPFAEVAVLRGDREVAAEFTPVRLRRMEVGEAPVRIRLSWPSREDARVCVTHEVKDLRDGQLVVVSGDISKSDTKVERR